MKNATFRHPGFRGLALILPVLVITLGACRTANTSQVSGSALEQSIFAWINEYRNAHGLESLEWHARVAELARQHSRDMAQDKAPFGHDGFTSRVAELSKEIRLKAAAENVGMTSALDSPARVVVDAWIDSEIHRVNLMGDYQLTGVGVARNDGTNSWYFTQIYVKLRP